MFIAVITETFAEIRVQFSQIWATREVLTEEDFRQVDAYILFKLIKLISQHFAGI